MTTAIKYLTPEEVAKRVEGLSASTLREMAVRGEIVALKIGRGKYRHHFKIEWSEGTGLRWANREARAVPGEG